MAATTRRPRRSAKKEPKTRPNFAEKARTFISRKDQVTVINEDQDKLKAEIMSEIAEWGELDDKGSQLIELDEPVIFTDHKGKTFRYTSLKRQRSLTPKDPTPDDAEAENLLKKKGMWLTAAQEKQLQQLRIALRFARITVEVSPDAIAEAYFEGLISEEEYDSILVEQKEGWAFVQLEE